MPPSCAHCKEVGYIQRHCPLLPPPTALTPKQNPPPKSPNTQPPSSSHPPKKANPSNKFCFSCRTMGHLMNNFDIAIDPPSMEIDTPSPTKETIIDCSDMDSSSAEVFVLALPAVFKDRPIIISNNHLPPKNLQPSP
ncbi:unnamed protein product [Brassica oleracea]